MQKAIKMLVKHRAFNIKSEGRSMMPLLQSGDKIFLKKISFRQIKVNDVIMIKTNKKLVTHRIIYKNKEWLITKGDNNLQSDGKVYPNQIIGKVYQIKRNRKTINLETQYLLQSTVYFQEITLIKQALEKEKNNFIFLKGLLLHLYYEKTHPKRIYADCDVLVNKKDFLKAESVIKKFGYRQTTKERGQIENNYLKNINGFPVIFDLHLEPAFLMTQFSGLEALYPQKFINKFNEELLNNKQQIKINNEKFFILNIEYLILYLVLHIFHHNFQGAFRYQFLDTVIRKSRLSTSDWQKISSITKEYKLDNFVYPVFVLLKKYYQTPISYFVRVGLDRPLHLNIFDDQSRMQAGIIRFKNLFFLSPNPWWKKVFVFTNKSVIYFIFWSLKKKLFSFFLNQRAN